MVNLCLEGDVGVEGVMATFEVVEAVVDIVLMGLLALLEGHEQLPVLLELKTGVVVISMLPTLPELTIGMALMLLELETGVVGMALMLPVLLGL